MLLGTLTDVEDAMDSYELKGSENFTGARSYFDFLIPAVKKSEITCIRHDRSGLSVQKSEKEEKENSIFDLLRSREISVPDHIQSEIDRRLGFCYPFQDALLLKSKFTVSDLNRLSKGQDLNQRAISPLPVPEFMNETHYFTSAEKGTILHTIMEHLDFHDWPCSLIKNKKKERIASYIQSAVDELVKKEILTSEEKKAVDLTKIETFFLSPIGERACRAEYLYKETSFNIVKEISGEKIIVQGTIDCYFEEQGRIILLDYKSNAARGTDRDAEQQRIADSYRLQMQLYREALEVIQQVKVEEAYLYLFDMDEAVRM